jgi:hypothetical protein
MPHAWACEVPDTDFDVAPLWRRVMLSKAKTRSGADKQSRRETFCFDTVIYRLGIDVNPVAMATYTPQTVFDMQSHVIDKSLAFPHLSNAEQAANVAQQLKHIHAANEFTQRDHTMRLLLPLARVPDPDSKQRILRPLLVSRDGSASSDFGQAGPIEKRQYYYVRHADGRPLAAADIREGDDTKRPFESELYFRSNLHMMAWATIIKSSLRAALQHLPGVCMNGLGCAPFLSIEHKPKDDDASVREAFYQAAVSSSASGCLAIPAAPSTTSTMRTCATTLTSSAGCF